MKALKLHFGRGCKAILIFSLLFTVKNSSAVSWYVSKAGNDTLNGLYPVFSAGYDGPKATIVNALFWANPGDTIYIAKGDYQENVEITKDIYISTDSVTVKHWNMNSAAVYCLLMGNYLDISDSLELNKGYMYINSPGFQLRTLTTCKIYGGSSLSFVEGKLYRALSGGTGRFFYPLGIAGDYRPAYLNYHQLPGDDRFHFMEIFSKPAPFSNRLPAGIRNISNVRYWNFGRVGEGTAVDYIFELAYDSILYDDHVYDPNNIRVLFNTDTALNWKDMSGNGDQPRKGIIKSGLATDTIGMLAIGNINGGFNPLGTDLPFARFFSSGNCVKSPFSFYDRSKNLPSPKIVKWKWDFGVASATNDTSSLQAPTYTYNTAGTFNVKLIITNDSGDVDTVENKVKVRPLPVVKFSATAECLNDANRFADSSTVSAPDSIFARNWKFGDGTFGTGAKTSHIYGNAGTFAPKLIATSSAGCKDSASGVALVRSLPKLDFLTSNVCSTDSAVYRRLRGVDPNDATNTYAWNIDNAIVGNDTILKFRYNNAAVHKVILIATDKFGCIDLLLKPDTSFGPPKISFTLDKSITGNDSLQCKTTNKYTFKPKISAGQSQTFTGSWTYGDGGSGILKDSVHSYAGTGTYTVKLFAQTNRGCRDSFSRVYKVRGLITPVIAKTGNCAPDSITLYDSATTSTSAVTSWKWSLPGGLTGSGKTLRVWNKFPTPGLVKLVVTNAEGCMDSVSKAFSYTLYPVISQNTVYGSIPFCPEDSLVLTYTGGTKYLWLNDNDTTSVKKVFKKAGLYPIRVYNGPLCSVTDSTLLITLKAPALIKAYSDTAVQRGNTATLRATGGVTYSWSPSATLNKNSGSKVIATPVATTTYIVSGTGANGCKGSDSVLVILTEPAYIRIPNIITPNGDGENDAWVLSDMKDLPMFDVTITDYAGKIIYTNTTGYKNDWNATDNGTELPEGIYYYKLKNRNSSETIKGFIQVIR